MTIRNNKNACDLVCVIKKVITSKPKSHSKFALRQSHTSAKEKIWIVIKRLHFDGDKAKPLNCRREFVNASRNKPTAREKNSIVKKRLLHAGDRLNFQTAVGGRFEQTYFALISAYCFGKQNALLLSFAAMGKRKCPAAARAAQVKPAHKTHTEIRRTKL